MLKTEITGWTHRDLMKKMWKYPCPETHQFPSTRVQNIYQGTWFQSKVPVVRVYLLVERVGNLTASNFCLCTFVVASTHEAIEAEHCGGKMLSQLTVYLHLNFRPLAPRRCSLRRTYLNKSCSQSGSLPIPPIRCTFKRLVLPIETRHLVKYFERVWTEIGAFLDMVILTFFHQFYEFYP